VRMRRSQVASDFYRAFRIENANQETHYLGLMDEECPHCHALYFTSVPVAPPAAKRKS
jgi:hypothetical protein